MNESLLAAALDEVRAYYKSQNMGNRIGFGKKPAIVVIDYQKCLTDPTKPAGSNMDAEILSTAKLLDKAREKGVRIIFTVTTYAEDGFDGGLWVKKVPVTGTWKDGSEDGELDERLNHRPGEIIMVKKYCSIFSSTALASFLTAEGIDTLIVTGCSTSGCIRASVTDSACNGFRTILPRECIGDRAQIPHEVNLLDMDTRFADVLPLQEVMAYLDKL